MPISNSSIPVSSRFSELASGLRTSTSLSGHRIFGVEVPLRICPLGAHVDHQGGRVTGMAVDRSVMMAAVSADGPFFTIESMDFSGSVVVDVRVEPDPARHQWGDYVRAAVSALRSRYPLDRGLTAVIGGELAGAGLSSSAAVLIAYLVSLAKVNGIDLEPDETATFVQRAENTYIGVASGLLDQSVMIHADRGKLTVIDCIDSTIKQIESPASSKPIAVVVAFSGAARALVDSGYNSRVSECADAARRLLAMDGEPGSEVSRLRDVDPGVFAENGRRLPEDLRLRATHYFTEMERVAAGITAWRRGDVEGFGKLMTDSGESSIINYQCGTPPLVTLHELLASHPGVYGTRFSGGGFGGTCIALAAPEACDDIVKSVRTRYVAEHPELASSAAYWVCRTAGPMRVFDHEY